MVPVVPVNHCKQPGLGRHSAVQAICITWMFQLRVPDTVQVNVSVLHSDCNNITTSVYCQADFTIFAPVTDA